ncbi:MAG: hypothetical protein AAFS06_02775 [Cyanobacteria bacterium J06631_12]
MSNPYRLMTVYYCAIVTNDARYAKQYPPSTKTFGKSLVKDRCFAKF